MGFKTTTTSHVGSSHGPAVVNKTRRKCNKCGSSGKVPSVAEKNTKFALCLSAAILIGWLLIFRPSDPSEWLYVGLLALGTSLVFLLMLAAGDIVFLLRLKLFQRRRR